MSEGVEYKLALKAVYEFLERLRVVQRNIKHLQNLVYFLSKYYKEYYCEGQSENLVYKDYESALELMKDDAKDLYFFCEEELIPRIESYVLNKSGKSEDGIGGRGSGKKEGKEFYEVKRSLFEDILYKGFNKKCASPTYDKYLRGKTLKDRRIGNVFDALAIIRWYIKGSAESYTVSFGTLSTALAYLAHSIDQSMSGLFVGNLIEHQPSVYTHKDLYHTMHYASLYCKSYHYSLKNLFEKAIEDEDNKKLFYKVSGINLLNDSSNNSNNNRDLEYTIVFGDCTLPQLLDRYKLIALPIICAYRPRYWSTLAHEIAHSYLHGLINCKKIKEEVRNEKGENDKKSREGAKNEDIKKLIEESLSYCSDMVASDPIIGGAFQVRKGKRESYYEVGASEIIADVFGFLLGGYSYIPALIFNIFLGPPDEIPQQRLPYALRVGVIIEVARKFTENELQNKENPLERLKKRVKKLITIQEENNWNACKEICKKFKEDLEDRSVPENFLNAYTNLFTECLIPEKPKAFLYLDYIFSFGRDIGKTLYDRYVDNILEFVLEQNLCFGWIPSEDENPKEIKHTVLNLLLNWWSFKRFKEIEDKSTSQELDEVLCLSDESVELYNWMKLVDWEVKS